MSEIKLAQHKPPSERGVAWCPDCLSYGTPFMDRNDRVCGNCGKENLEYLWSERHYPRCRTCEHYQAKFTVNQCCHPKVHGKDFYPDPDFGCKLFELKESHEKEK